MAAKFATNRARMDLKRGLVYHDYWPQCTNTPMAGKAWETATLSQAYNAFDPQSSAQGYAVGSDNGVTRYFATA
jgi:hypothetical protein